MGNIEQLSVFFLNNNDLASMHGSNNKVKNHNSLSFLDAKGSFQPNSSNPCQVKNFRTLKIFTIWYSHWEWKVPQISAAEPKRFRFYGHFKGFPWWIWGQNVIWSILSVPLRVWKLKWKYCFWGSLNTTWLCFRKNEIWNLSLIQKRIVEVVKNEKIAFWH